VIIADADIWIDYFKDPDSRSGQTLGGLVKDGRVALVGIVLAEVMRGARDDQQRLSLKAMLDAVPYLEIPRSAWEMAGSIAQMLDAAGQPLAVPDIIIAASVLQGDHELFTRDKHFQHIPGLRLYDPDGDPDA
jgi:predicted nucleic acid-binding protein